LEKEYSSLNAEPHTAARTNFNMKLGVNTPADELAANIRHNITRQLPQMSVHPARPGPVAIVGGGWSLEETLDELVEMSWAGVPIIALNGAGNYLVERNIRPAALAVLDARGVNVTFVQRDIPGCKYLLGSQCHPAVFDACEDRDVRIFHVDDSEELDAYYNKQYHAVPGGSTVGLRAIPLAHMMGFREMHLFGMDSCHAPDGRHHSFAQDWNENEATALLTVGARQFRCSVWQVSQAKEFVNFIGSQGEHFRLDIHGDGLLAHIIKAGAKLEEEKWLHQD
jgi:hypothetical protein